MAMKCPVSGVTELVRYVSTKARAIAQTLIESELEARLAALEKALDAK
jgi:hypothetical protein